MQKNKIKDKFNVYQQSKLRFEEEFLNSCSTRLQDETPFYKIVSIDGGGMRGILPALYSAELERRLKRPMSGIFQMACGTSTGAIIAAGLSVPASRPLHL